MQRMNNPNYSRQVIHGDYYPHIDGIRALAVLPVVLFHILACLCPGGFAGVDVFFVISGYLITGGILRDLEKDRFTIRNFYYRRIRRIMPAYFALIAGVFIVGCTVYYCLPLMHLGDASVMGTLFSANFYFWKMGGDYFAPDVHRNPLLHLWSLSVEEQFYLFIPLLCAIVWKIRRNWLVPTLTIIAILSFSSSVYAVATGKQNNAFYLLQYRAWELLAGSLLATLPIMKKTHDPKLETSTGSPNESSRKISFNLCLAFIGLLMVLIPYALISSKTPFPGIAALSSVLGTALLIRYGQTGWINTLLSWRPFVFVGKISYSLYLLHWPVTVFWKYIVYDQLCIGDYIGMFLLSLLLAYLSWRIIEIPVRTSSAWTMRRSFAFAATGIVLLVSVSLACVFNRGWSKQLHPEANKMAGLYSYRPQFVESLIRNKIQQLRKALGLGIKDYQDPFLAYGTGDDFTLGIPTPPEFFLVGDSHARILQHGLDCVMRQNNHSGYAMTRSAKDVFNLQEKDAKDILAELEKQPQVSKVVLVEYWSSQHKERNRGSERQTMYLELERFSREIKEMGKTLFIATDVPLITYSVSDIAAKREIISPRHIEAGWDGQQSEAKYDKQQGEINRRLEEICHKTGAILIPLHLALKQGDHYIAFDKQNGKTIPLYMDDNHLSPEGSLRAASVILSCLFPQDGTNPRESEIQGKH